MTKDDIKYRQGRSKHQYVNNAKGAFFSMLGCFVLLIIMIITK